MEEGPRTIRCSRLCIPISCLSGKAATISFLSFFLFLSRSLFFLPLFRSLSLSHSVTFNSHNHPQSAMYFHLMSLTATIIFFFLSLSLSHLTHTIIYSRLCNMYIYPMSLRKGSDYYHGYGSGILMNQVLYVIVCANASTSSRLQQIMSLFSTLYICILHMFDTHHNLCECT